MRTRAAYALAGGAALAAINITGKEGVRDGERKH